VSLSLVAAACSDKKDDDSVTIGTDATVEDTSPEATTGDTATEATAPVVTDAPESEFDPVMGGKIVVAGEAETANPWTPADMNCDSFCQMRARTFYDPLVVVGTDLEVQPYLAESVEANDDSTEFTITIRQGITFHDGTDLDADAVMENINRSFTSLLIGAAVKDIAKNEDGSVKMEKVDDSTFKLFTGKNGDPNTPVSWPLFPYYLGGQGGLIASPTWLADVDAGGDPTKAVGTGPFMLDSYAPGDKLVVKKNPDYWVQDENGNALPYLDEIEFRVIPDSQVRSEALKSGDVDLISTSDTLVVGTLAEEGEFTYVNQDQYSETNYILFNLTKPYLADQSVRCALAQAIDKQDLVDVVTGGYGTVSNQMFTQGQEGFIDGDNGAPQYDPEAAAAAIADWEAANGPLTINYSTTPTATSLTTAQYLADAWGQVGVDVVIDQIEQSKLISNALFGDPAFDAFGWRNHAGLFVDQQYFWWSSSAASDPGQLALNFGRLRDPEIDSLLDQSRSETDPEARKGFAEEINRRFAEQCFTIPTAPTKWGVFYDPAIQNIGRSPLPDGDGFMRDGAGFPGQVWLSGVFVAN
jgi:ABC-type transport system substrate-binding protein